jgi:hypothetical protein
MIFRRAMALEAPGHALGLVLIDHFHLVNRAMTGKAAYTAVHVHRVIEIGVVRDAVDLYPIDCRAVTLSTVPCCAHGLKLRTLGLSLLVTAHTGLHSWHI